MSNHLKTEDEVLDFTQAQRELLVQAMTAGGKMPADPKEIKALLSALDGMDKAALTKKRLKQDADMGSKIGEANAAITALLTNHRKDIKIAPQEVPVERTDLGMPPEMQAPTLVPGELERVNPNLDYDQVIGSQE